MICVANELSQQQTPFDLECSIYDSSFATTGQVGADIMRFSTRVCSVSGCNEKHSALGYCKAHYSQLRKYGRVTRREIKKTRLDRECSIISCQRSYRCKGYCEAHYAQFLRNGRITSGKIISHLNKIDLYEDYAEIEMYNKNCEPIGYAKIDLEDVEKVKEYKWGLCHGYVTTRLNKKGTINLSDFLMNFKGNRQRIIDHMNRDKLDNRKGNLRIASSRKNALNRYLTKISKSGVIGVYYDPSNAYWIAKIHVNGKQIYGGYFKNKEGAVKSRKELEQKYGYQWNILEKRGLVK